VDGDEDSRFMLIMLLGFAMIEAKAAGDAVEALSLMQAERFDLCLLDAWLPGIDGFELCRRIRASDSLIPILFFSGAAYESDRKRGIEAGANAYLMKPEVDALTGVILQFVSPLEEPTAKIIPFERKIGLANSSIMGPAAA
jgi:two-component system OmpR family response regulator